VNIRGVVAAVLQISPNNHIKGGAHKHVEENMVEK
jgi:hypothetical protein